jgi:diguanylate cyclase (GGDEF)-like protein
VPGARALAVMKMRSIASLFLFLLVALFGGAAPASGAVIDAGALPQGSLSLTSSLSVLEDPQQNLDFAAVRQAGERFIASGQTDEALSYGYTRSAYWLRLDLRNPGDQPLERMLEISNARLGDITVYRADAAGRYAAHHTGSAQPFGTRAYANRYFVFPLQLAPQAQTTVYIRVASNGAKLIPVRLWEPAAYHAYERHDYLMQGVYFGIALAMALFNLVLFAILGDRLYIQYVGFVVLAALGLAGQNGLTHEWLWPGASGAWPNQSASICFSLAAAMLIVFMRRMLATATLIPRLDKVLIALLVFFVVSPVAMVVFYTHVAKPITTIWSVASPLILLIAVVCAFHRQRGAYYFLAAFVMLFIGNMSSSLAALGVLPHNLLSNHGSQIGSCCEMMMLAFALADRVQTIRREKARAQRGELTAQANLIAGLQASERMLEERVTQRTMELQIANDDLAALSMTDGLTGIANRRRFDEVLAAEWARAARQGHPLAIGLLDIDHFKLYNDHYGHQQGDACLRRVAKVFKAQLQRGGDLVARYGGEEFVFIAPAVDVEQAHAIAHGVCEAIASLDLPHASAPSGHVTVSIGVAAWIPLAGTPPEAILRAADQALYRAKQLGRNRAEAH